MTVCYCQIMVKKGSCNSFLSPSPSQFFPSGNAIITGSDDCSCKMYDLRSDQEVNGYQDSSLNAGITSLALSNSGRLIFAGYDDFNCHIWDSLKGEKVGEWLILQLACRSLVCNVQKHTDSHHLLSYQWKYSVVSFLPLLILLSLLPFPCSLVSFPLSSSVISSISFFQTLKSVASPPLSCPFAFFHIFLFLFYVFILYDVFCPYLSLYSFLQPSPPSAVISSFLPPLFGPFFL